MALSCPLGFTRCVLQKKFGFLSHKIDRLLTKLVRLRWLDIGFIVLPVYGSRLRVSSPEKNEANISHLD